MTAVNVLSQVQKMQDEIQELNKEIEEENMKVKLKDLKKTMGSSDGKYVDLSLFLSLSASFFSFLPFFLSFIIPSPKSVSLYFFSFSL